MSWGNLGVGFRYCASWHAPRRRRGVESLIRRKKHSIPCLWEVFPSVEPRSRTVPAGRDDG